MRTIQISTIQTIQEGTGLQTSGRSAGSGRAPVPSVPATTRDAAAEPAASAVEVLDTAAAQTFAGQIQEALNRMAPAPYQIEFRRDEATNGFVIELRNPDGSLIRQYPPEKLLNLRRKLDELSGMVIDEMT